MLPKEIVRGCHPVIGTPDEVQVEGLVQVTWGIEQEYVQVVTLRRDATTLESNSDEAIHVDVDRRGINDLIRNLRRARDQAYGRDE